MRELLVALWETSASQPGALTLWLSPSKKSIHVPLSSIEDLDADDVARLAEHAGDQHVYFGLGARVEGLSPQQQGGKKDILALPGIALDIDYYNPLAHKAINLPADFEEAFPLIESLPEPSALVGTGNGAHVYWFFQEPLVLDSPSRRTQTQRALKKFQEPIIAKAAELGWHLDSTASIQRVWRVPGFINQKTNKLVELLYCDARQRYPIEQLGLSMPKRRTTTIDRPPPKTLLEKIRNSLRRVSPNNKFYHAIQAALDGKSMANPGERDETLQGVCSTIAWLPDGRDADPEQLAEVLRDSLAAWAAEDDADKSLDEELSKAADKILRSQEDYQAKQEAKRPQLDGIAKALGVDLDDSSEANAFFLQHALIQYRAAFYAYDFRKDEYSIMKTAAEIENSFLRDAWADGPDELDINYVNDKGQTKAKTLKRICSDYCTNTDAVIGKLTINESSFHAQSSTFYEAMAPMRVIDAEHDPQIDEWLRELAGDAYDKVCDWIATVPMLDEPNSALYLDGHSGAGKGLLANGLTRLWREGSPTPFAHAIDNFNAEIMECPLVWIDEGISTKRGSNITAQLRSLIGQKSFSINQKNLPIRTVLGCIRLLICANNDNVLMIGDTELGAKDLEAIKNRILHVHARKGAANWLKEHNTAGQLTRRWVEEDGIARHCLHLARTRTVDPGQRFLVEGIETEMHRRLIMQGEIDGLVYEWVVRFSTNPDAVYMRYKKTNEASRALIGNGEIFINSQGVVDCWDVYMPADIKRPTSGRIGRVLKKLSYRVSRLGPRGDRHRYHVIKSGLALEWCKQQQIGNEDKIMDNLSRKIELGDEQTNVG